MKISSLLQGGCGVLIWLTCSVIPDARSFAQEATDGFQVHQQDAKLIIEYNTRPVTQYVFRDDKILRPYFSNVRLPGGLQVTRNHPPNPASDAVDHDTMHPGVWLGFGELNGEDFWRNKGRIKHVRFAKEAVVRSDAIEFADESHFFAADGRKLAELHSGFQLSHRLEGFLLTWDANIRATEEDLVFGDQEEMGLGARIATSLTEKAGGTLTSSDGIQGAAATWGRTAAWCDYSGKAAEQIAGITIIPARNNPYACWWHNRDYGVFVANPFGKRAGHSEGKLTVSKGTSLRLKFHVLFHEGKTLPDLTAIAKELAM